MLLFSSSRIKLLQSKPLLAYCSTQQVATVVSDNNTSKGCNYSFKLFLQDNQKMQQLRATLRPNAEGKTKSGDFLKCASSLWRSLPAAEKEAYRCESNEDVPREKLLPLVRPPARPETLYARTVPFNGKYRERIMHLRACNAEFWQLDKSERKKFNAEAQRLKAEYQLELDCLTRKERAQLVNMQKQLKLNRLKKKERRMERSLLESASLNLAKTYEHTEPILPSPPHVLFEQSLPLETSGRAGKRQRSKKASDLWKTMTEAQRQPFIDQFEKAKAHYMQKLALWSKQLRSADTVAPEESESTASNADHPLVNIGRQSSIKRDARQKAKTTGKHRVAESSKGRQAAII